MCVGMCPRPFVAIAYNSRVSMYYLYLFNILKFFQPDTLDAVSELWALASSFVEMV